VSDEGPGRSAAPPAAVRELATGREVCLAWENQDALTFEVGDGPDRCFVKWAPAGSPLDLAAEAARMTWAVAYSPVPRALGLGADSDGSWLAAARRAADAGHLGTSEWEPEHLELGVEGAIAQAQNIPPADKLVVCHVDACAPNTLIADNGRWSGHVDLGDLGVADLWADLAVATWSTEWNYGPDWEPVLLGAYGIKPDAERTRYDRLLWELG
jgi:kanamycin kinase